MNFFGVIFPRKRRGKAKSERSQRSLRRAAGNTRTWLFSQALLTLLHKWERAWPHQLWKWESGIYRDRWLLSMTKIPFLSFFLLASLHWTSWLTFSDHELLFHSFGNFYQLHYLYIYLFIYMCQTIYFCGACLVWFGLLSRFKEVKIFNFFNMFIY